MAYGHLECHDDPTTWAKKIVYSANMKVAHMVSQQVLDSSHMPVKALASEIAHQMAKYFQKDIEELLLAEFAGKDQKIPHGWNSAPLSDIHAGISEMSQDLAQGSLYAQKPPTPKHPVLVALEKAVPGLRNAVSKYPCGCKETQAKVSSIIIHLNDREKWTREQIADWLETLDVDLSFVPPADALPPAPDAHEKIDIGLDKITWDDWQKSKKDALLAAAMSVPVIQDPEAFAKILGTGI